MELPTGKSTGSEGMLTVNCGAPPPLVLSDVMEPGNSSVAKGGPVTKTLAVVNDGLEMSHFYGLKLNHLVFAQRFGQCA